MDKLFNFTQTKGKWHKFPSFNLGGGAKLYKNFAQKLLAVSLCAAMVLCTVPLRGGSHVSEAADGDGTVLHVAVRLDSQPKLYTPAAAWESFDLSQPPSVTYSVVVDGVPFVWPAFFLFSGAVSPSLQPVLAWTKSGVSGLSYSAPAPSAVVPAPASVPRCVGAWSASGGLAAAIADGAPESVPVVSFPALPPSLLASWSVPVAVGSSASWSPGVAVAHCDECAVTLVAAANAPVTVAGDYDTGWTLARTGAGTTVLDLKVGDFKVGEVTVTEAAGNPDTTPDQPVDRDGTGYLEATVGVNGRTQRLRVYNPNNVLPADTTFTAEYVDGTHGDHNFFITYTDPTSDVELRHYYNLTLASGGQTLSQLDGPVELWFEAIDGMDAPDAFISRVTEGADAKLAPEVVVDADGVTWIKVLTDHFSPYALTDLLSAEEKAVLGNVKTGDLPTQLTVAGLGMTLVLALGIMLRLITNKRKFEE